MPKKRVSPGAETSNTSKKPKAKHEESLAVQAIKANITEPNRWVNPEHLLEVMRDNPSLRGFTYGYVAENEFVHWLKDREIEAHQHYKPDDHKKTKSDRTLTYKGKAHTIQLKSMQTNSIRDAKEADRKAGIKFTATVQNDASDSRDVLLPNGHTVHTTCYKAGEYDVLCVSIQPFVGRWDFAFKRNGDLRRTTDPRYAGDDRQYLLATTERITWPLSDGWTTELFSLLGDVEIKDIVVDAEPDVASSEHTMALVEPDE
jgi:hypothetical protein